MGVSDPFPRDSHPRSGFARMGDELGVWINADLAAYIGPLIDRDLRRYREAYRSGASQEVEVFRRRIERLWADTSSRSTAPLPQPDAGERERIGAVEAAKRLGISRARFGQRCRRGDFDTARQDDSRGWWSIEVAEVDVLAGRGRTGSCMSPSDPEPGGAA